MASIRISGNWRNPNREEWGAALEVDKEGNIDRSLDLPEEVFAAIENQLRQGGREGRILLEGGQHVNWLVD